VGKLIVYSFRYNTTWQTDWQTDRRSELVKQYCAMYDMRAEAR